MIGDYSLALLLEATWAQHGPTLSPSHATHNKIHSIETMHLASGRKLCFLSWRLLSPGESFCKCRACYALLKVHLKKSVCHHYRQAHRHSQHQLRHRHQHHHQQQHPPVVRLSANILRVVCALGTTPSSAPSSHLTLTLVGKLNRMTCAMINRDQ